MEYNFSSIDKTYLDFSKKNHVPGYAFGIVQAGKLVYSGSGGYINISEKIPATPQSLFRLASITKSFTAMAILKLRDQSALNLSDPIYHYIPQIKNQRPTQDTPDITIRDLLIHIAGLPQDDPWADRKLSMSENQLLAFIEKGISFSSVPGTAFEYSNLGYAMLGYIVKKISGMSYQEFVNTYILKPLEMTQTAWEFTNISKIHLAHGYRWINNSWQEEALLSDGAFAAMGGLFSSIESFSRYVAFHLSAWPPRDDDETEPLKRSSLREMHQPHNIRYGADTKNFLLNAYGFGLRWFSDNQKIYIGHSGGLPGFGSNWLILPEYDIGIILFANVTYAPAENINLQILKQLLPKISPRTQTLSSTSLLNNRKDELVKLLPYWEKALECPFFSDNFFIDNPLDQLQAETAFMFVQAGNIIKIGELVAENNLRGYFIIKGEKANLRVHFALTPELVPLIQELNITQEEIKHVRK